MPGSTSQHAIPSTATDLELLRAFEPIVRFTSGEQFFPMGVEPYVQSCGLWLYHPDDRDEELIPEGAMTMDALVGRGRRSSAPCSTYGSSARWASGRARGLSRMRIG